MKAEEENGENFNYVKTTRGLPAYIYTFKASMCLFLNNFSVFIKTKTCPPVNTSLLIVKCHFNLFLKQVIIYSEVKNTKQNLNLIKLFIIKINFSIKY